MTYTSLFVLFGCVYSDKIAVGSYHGYLRIYNPNPVRGETGWSGFKPEDVVCENHLQLPIIQIEAGRFVS